MKKNKVKSLKLNSILNAVYIILQSVFPLITFPYIAGVLSPAGLGKVNYASAFVSYFILIASLGVNKYASREGSRCREEKDKLNQFSTEIFILNSISTVIAYLLFTAIFFLPQFKEYRIIVLIYSINILIIPFKLEWVFSIFEEYGFIVIRYFIIQVFSVLALFTLVKDTNDYIVYASINVAGVLFNTITNWKRSKKFINIHKTVNLDLKRHIKPVLIMWGLTATVTIYANSDILILGFMKGDTEVGYYSVVVKIITMLVSVFSVIGSVLFVRFPYYIKNGELDKINYYSKKGLHILLAVSIPSVFGLIVIAKPLITIFAGVKYLEALTTFKILALNVMLAPAASYIANLVLVPFGKEKYTLIATGISSLANIILNILVIPRFSMNGAAVTTLLSQIITIVIAAYFSNKLIKIRTWFTDIYQYIIAGLPIFLIAFVNQKFLSGGIAYLIATVTESVVCYAFLLLWMKNKLALEQAELLCSKLRRRNKC